MIELVLQAPSVEAWLPTLRRSGHEACVVLFTRALSRPERGARLLEVAAVIPGEADYQRRSSYEAELRPAFVASVTKRAAQHRLGVVFVHSHPEADPLRFSPTDDAGEGHLADFLHRRVPTATHCSVVIGPQRLIGRIVGSQEPIRIIEVGARRRVLAEGSLVPNGSPLEEYDRQVRLLGAEGQRRIGELRIAIVGVGGTGSVVAQELAHLGVTHFLLIDPDVIEPTNLNRVVGATLDDVGKAKVDVAKGSIRRINAHTMVNATRGDIMRSSVARQATEVDLIFGCTDSHGSRSVLQQIAYQYLIPCIDMGSTIVVQDGAISHIHGRVQLLAPGLPCLTCSELLDPNEVRRDMMTAFERRSDPYIVGAAEPAPAVMSLNATVASLGVTMFLSVVAGLPGDARNVLYDAIGSSLRKLAPRPNPECFICSSAGALAQGDEVPLLARKD